MSDNGSWFSYNYQDQHLNSFKCKYSGSILVEEDMVVISDKISGQRSSDPRDHEGSSSSTGILVAYYVVIVFVLTVIIVSVRLALKKK